MAEQAPTRLVRASGLVAAATAVLQAATLVRSALPAWLPLPAAAASLLLAAAACALPARQAAAGTVRRFWGRLTAALAVGGGTVAGSGHPDVARYGFGAAIVLALWAFAGLPAGPFPAARRREMWFDIAAVVFAGSLLAWYFRTDDAGSSPGGRQLIILAILVMMVAGRVAQAGARTVDRLALRSLGWAMAAVVGVVAYVPVLDGRPGAAAVVIAAPLVGLAVTAAARSQGAATDRVPGSGRRVRRPTLLPYVGVTIIDVLLINAVHRSTSQIIGLTLGSIGLTLVVVVRQVLVFRDNGRLLDRLDAGMLELGRQEARFRYLAQEANDVITIIDQKGVLLYASPRLEHALGYTPEQVVGTSVIEYIHPDDQHIAVESLTAALSRFGHRSVWQLRYRHAHGSWRWMEIVNTNLLDEPSVRGIVSTGRDITEARQHADELAYRATHDQLTGLPNRDLFTRTTTQMLEEAGPDAKATVVLVDLDDFKSINDRLGHAVGDALIVAVGARLGECLRTGDTLARLGGDEFGLLLSGAGDDEATRVIEHVLAALHRPVAVAGYELVVHGSIGLTTGGLGEGQAIELLRQADVAMYAAKESGGNRCVRYEPGMDAAAHEHARLAAELHQALDNGEFHLLYQPIVGLPDGDLIGVEALVRWHHPVRGLVSPVDFIPVAEHTGLIVPVGEWVLREACRQGAEWQLRHGDRALRKINVNVSARQLQEPSFVGTVAAVLAESGLDPSRLVIEITETAVFGGGSAAETVAGLRELGCRIALDDFGTGHSSLGLLRTCPVDVIKVDKSFVDGVGGTLEQEAIATSIGQIAQALRLEAVAEGVETAAQADRLHQLGFRQAQGFYFARPLTADALEALLDAPSLRPAAVV
ncbi:putative bifunctional diguanylate cyclase/phosphodiesterase [Actinoplanes sp. NPDC049681]|uniref:putative bifunctional diguanylate cyclase/phosphodiesterase n=1 Tax=Actinoplanes sp. NPDC049681 TaxID=3363905 RepID=UPI0037B463C8